MMETEADAWAAHKARLRPSICTYLGEEFFPMSPEVEKIHITDIGHALSNTARFAGHTSEFYSVAQHSVLVAEILRQTFPDQPDLFFWGLLHDASEAYLTDIPAPLKQHLTGYQEMEDRVQAAVAERFGLCWPMPTEVKWADKAAFTAEAADLMPLGLATWWPMLPRDAAAPPTRIQPMPPAEARRLFFYHANRARVA